MEDMKKIFWSYRNKQMKKYTKEKKYLDFMMSWKEIPPYGKEDTVQRFDLLARIWIYITWGIAWGCHFRIVFRCAILYDGDFKGYCRWDGWAGRKEMEMSGYGEKGNRVGDEREADRGWWFDLVGTENVAVLYINDDDDANLSIRSERKLKNIMSVIDCGWINRLYSLVALIFKEIWG